MIGRVLAVDTDNGPIETTVTPRVAVAFERHHKRGLIPAITQDQKMEHLYWLVWEGLRTSGGTVPPFDKWLDTVTGLVTVVEESEGPLDSDS